MRRRPQRRSDMPLVQESATRWVLVPEPERITGISVKLNRRCKPPLYRVVVDHLYDDDDLLRAAVVMWMDDAHYQAFRAWVVSHSATDAQ
jgi:hypothetical protein